MVDNRTLTVLVLVAMSVSLVGTLATISLVKRPEAVTGLAAHAGLTNVSIQRYGDITLNVDLVNFGTIETGQSNETSDYSPHPFVLENNGSTFVNVSVYASDLWDQAGNPTVNFQVNASDDNETGTLSGTDGFASTFINMPSDSPPAPQTIIECMNYTDNNDAMNVHIKITVPGGEKSGYKESTVTFSAQDSLQGNCGD